MGIMMSCKDVAERANALIDGELGLADRLKIRLHLAICKGCDHFVAQMHHTKALIRASAAIPQGEAPPAALDAILTRLAEQDPDADAKAEPDG